MSSASFRYLALILIGPLLALGAGSPAAASTGTGWLTVPVSGPDNINDIAASSANDLWVVGGEGGVGFAQHWNGASWDALQAAPAGSMLYGVAEISPTNLWAVGKQYSTSAGTDATLIEHGNGSTWKAVASPSPLTAHILWAVSGSSASNVWAVGQDFDPTAFGGAGSYEALMLHYDGTSWSQVPDATTGLVWGNLVSVSTVSGTDAWALGSASTGPGGNVEPLAEHWNGTAWTAVTLPAELATVSQIKQFGHNDVYVVGGDTGGASLLEHWNGTAWTHVPTAPLGALNGTLTSVGGSNASDVYLVGKAEDAGHTFDLVEHWDGTSWTVEESPNPNADPPYYTNQLRRVVSPAAGVAFAAGDSRGAPTVLRLGAGEFTSTVSLTAPKAGVAGQRVDLSGDLSFSEHAGTWDTALQLDRKNPNGTHTALPAAVVDSLGHYDVGDAPRYRGTYVYTVSYPGGGARSGSQAQATVNVTGTPTTLTLHPSATVVYHHTAVTVTAHLSAHGTNGTVSIYHQGVGGTRTLVKTAPVDADGNLRATVTIDLNNTFDAVYNGDSVYNPASSAKVKVAVRVGITGAQSGYYGTSAGYRLYHYKTSCVSSASGCPTYTAAVVPSHTGEKVSFLLQVLTASGWKSVGTGSGVLGPLSKTKIILRYGNRTIIGPKFREHASFAGDARNVGNTTGWAYFRITN